VITVPAEAVTSRPTVISVRAEHAAFGHTPIDLEPHASAVVALDHHGSATHAGNVEPVVGDGASLAWNDATARALDGTGQAHDGDIIADQAGTAAGIIQAGWEQT